MTTLPTVLISGASEELTAKIEQLIRSQAELSLIECLTPAEAATRSLEAKLVWLELQSDPAGNIVLLEKLVNKHPNIFFVVSKEELEPELVKRTMQIGALDFLDHKGWAAQIRSVIRRIMAKEFGTKPGAAPSTIAAIPRAPAAKAPSTSAAKAPAGAGFRRVEPNRSAPPTTAGSAGTKPAVPSPAAAAKPVASAPAPALAKAEEPAAKPAAREIAPPAAAKPATAGPPPAPAPAAKPASATPPPAPPPAPSPVSPAAKPEPPASPSAPADKAPPPPPAPAKPAPPPPPAGFNKPAAVDNAIIADKDAPVVPSRAAMGGRTQAFSGPKPPGPPPSPKAAESKSPAAAKEPQAAEPSTSSEEPSATDASEIAESERIKSLPLSTGEYQRPPRQTTPPPRQRIQSNTGSHKALSPASDLPESSEPDSAISQSNKNQADVNGSAQQADRDPGEEELPLEYQSEESDRKQESDQESDFEQPDSDSDANPEPTDEQIDDPAGNSMEPAMPADDRDQQRDLRDEDPSMTSAQDDEDVAGSAEDTAGGAGDKSPATPPVAKKGRWDELDSIISKEPSKAKDADTTKKASKWGDLDSIGTTKGFQKETPTSIPAVEKAKSKWGDLDNIGSKAAKSDVDEETAEDSPATPARSRWGDLDSIGTGKAASPSSEEADEEPVAGKGKWGDLDSIGTRPAGKTESPAEQNKWGDLNSIGAKAPAAESTGKSKWGDLDSIGTPAAEPAEKGKWGDLDSIKPPAGGADSGERSALPLKADSAKAAQQASAFKNRFGKKTQDVNMPDTAGEDSPESADAGQWGDLDSIAAPAARAADSGKWGNLDHIPTPKKTAAEPEKVGSLPVAQAPNQSSIKWKAGMDSDLNTGAREFGAMRDKIAGTKLPMPVVGWHNVNWLFAIIIFGSAIFLSVKFFDYPAQPTTQATAK